MAGLSLWSLTKILKGIFVNTDNSGKLSEMLQQKQRFYANAY